MSIKLSKEEKEILDSYENDEWVSISTPSRLEKYKEAARNTFKKNKRVNIRISEIDLELLHEKALIEGLPYQTLMSSILHKYVVGNARSLAGFYQGSKGVEVHGMPSQGLYDRSGCVCL